VEADIPVQGAIVSGIFTRANQTHNISGKTSASGDFSVPLPSGKLSVTSTSVEGKKYSINVNVPEPQKVNSLEEARKAKPMVNTVSNNATIAGLVSEASSLVILGDISGSMGSNMELLRKTYSGHVEKYIVQKRPIALASWNTGTFWCLNANWITEYQIPEAKKWISEQNAGGENDMKQAILSAIANRTDAEEILVICDGDVSPFSATTWTAFRAQYPSILFHFAALGKGSDFSTMQLMASIGGGSFTQANI